MATTRRRPARSLITLLIVVVIGVCALLVGHATRGAGLTPSLALDLEGGTQLILTPTSADGSDKEVTSADITEAINIIRNRVDASGVAEAEITSMGTDNIVVSLPGHPDKETLDLIRSSSQMDFRPVLVTGAATTTATTSGTDSTGAQSGTDSQSGTTSQSGSTAQSGATDDAQSGLVSTAMSEAEAKKLADTNGDGTISDTPATTPTDHSDTAWVTEKDLLEFYMLDCTDPASRAQGAVSDPDTAFVTCDEEGTYKYILGPVDVKGANLDSATAGLIYNSQGQSTGEWGVNLQFDATGTKEFAEASQRLYDLKSTDATRNRFAVVLDGNVITSPSMNTVITDGRAQISGSFTANSAKALANQLSFGSLPLDFTVQSEQQISATLGSDHLEKGIWAGVIGLVLVVLYMIWQYRGLAVLSAGSLLVAAGLTYLVITLLSWIIGYRLSLPGVAGLIVAVGITADSFIVYFERIRDEVRDGRPLVAAVDEGWDRAKRTIIVSDLVNLIAAVVLYVLAVGGVQGFAFTLGVTTIVDLVVIFFFTHPMMELLIRVPFFGEGHKLSGLDPEHLGAHSSAVYAGRGRVVVRGKGASGAAPATGATAGSTKSLAQRRFEAAHASSSAAPGDGGGAAVDGSTDETKGLDR